MVNEDNDAMTSMSSPGYVSTRGKIFLTKQKNVLCILGRSCSTPTWLEYSRQPLVIYESEASLNFQVQIIGLDGLRDGYQRFYTSK